MLRCSHCSLEIGREGERDREWVAGRPAGLLPALPWGKTSKKPQKLKKPSCPSECCAKTNAKTKKNRKNHSFFVNHGQEAQTLQASSHLSEKHVFFGFFGLCIGFCTTFSGIACFCWFLWFCFLSLLFVFCGVPCVVHGFSYCISCNASCKLIFHWAFSWIFCLQLVLFMKRDVHNLKPMFRVSNIENAALFSLQP